MEETCRLQPYINVDKENVLGKSLEKFPYVVHFQAPAKAMKNKENGANVYQTDVE